VRTITSPEVPFGHYVCLLKIAPVQVQFPRGAVVFEIVLKAMGVRARQCAQSCKFQEQEEGTSSWHAVEGPGGASLPAVAKATEKVSSLTAAGEIFQDI